MASLLLNNNMLLIMFTIIHVVSEGEGQTFIQFELRANNKFIVRKQWDIKL